MWIWSELRHQPLFSLITVAQFLPRSNQNTVQFIHAEQMCADTVHINILG